MHYCRCLWSQVMMIFWDKSLDRRGARLAAFKTWLFSYQASIKMTWQIQAAFIYFYFFIPFSMIHVQQQDIVYHTTQQNTSLLCSLYVLIQSSQIPLGSSVICGTIEKNALHSVRFFYILYSKFWSYIICLNIPLFSKIVCK